jgi:tRNA (cytidine32/uridine32-2'-O)-methyltransferase
MDIPVKIVLVETSHPGNIGAVARAMKTMGLRELALVKPKVFPSPEATARASGADDLLERALVHDSLAAAIGDCGFVVGTSARLRSLPCPTLTPRECAARVCEHSSHTKVAIVMGPEKSGLTNEHMSMCRLNLAMATQVICYELRMMALGEAARVPYERDAPLATASEVEGFQAHLERVLTEAKFLSPEHPTQLKLKLRRLFQRAELDRNEVNILRGVLAALEPSKKLPNE